MYVHCIVRRTYFHSNVHDIYIYIYVRVIFFVNDAFIVICFLINPFNTNSIDWCFVNAGYFYTHLLLCTVQ